MKMLTSGSLFFLYKFSYKIKSSDVRNVVICGKSYRETQTKKKQTEIQLLINLTVAFIFEQVSI